MGVVMDDGGCGVGVGVPTPRFAERRRHAGFVPFPTVSSHITHPPLPPQSNENTLAQCITYAGTVTYMSPERINSKPYDSKADVWSLGLTLLECALGRYPYDAGVGPLQLMIHICEDMVPLPKVRGKEREGEGVRKRQAQIQVAHANGAFSVATSPSLTPHTHTPTHPPTCTPPQPLHPPHPADDNDGHH